MCAEMHICEHTCVCTHMHAKYSPVDINLVCVTTFLHVYVHLICLNLHHVCQCACMCVLMYAYRVLCDSVHLMYVNVVHSSHILHLLPHNI